jgi:GNAT superfamily N-acetyltransferase
VRTPFNIPVRQRTYDAAVTITHTWRGDFDNDAVNSLHAECFDHVPEPTDWRARTQHHSLGWVCARDDHGHLVGFVNVARDGGAHAFLLDTMVATHLQRTGVGADLVTTAAQGARAAGCAWLHVDFEGHLRAFYVDACGLTPTDAALLALRGACGGVREGVTLARR